MRLGAGRRRLIPVVLAVVGILALVVVLTASRSEAPDELARTAWPGDPDSPGSTVDPETGVVEQGDTSDADPAGSPNAARVLIESGSLETLAYRLRRGALEASALHGAVDALIGSVEHLATTRPEVEWAGAGRWRVEAQALSTILPLVENEEDRLRIIGAIGACIARWSGRDAGTVTWCESMLIRAVCAGPSVLDADTVYDVVSPHLLPLLDDEPESIGRTVSANLLAMLGTERAVTELLLRLGPDRHIRTAVGRVRSPAASDQLRRALIAADDVEDVRAIAGALAESGPAGREALRSTLGRLVVDGRATRFVAVCADALIRTGDDTESLDAVEDALVADGDLETDLALLLQYGLAAERRDGLRAHLGRRPDGRLAAVLRSCGIRVDSGDGR